MAQIEWKMITKKKKKEEEKLNKSKQKLFLNYGHYLVLTSYRCISKVVSNDKTPVGYEKKTLFSDRETDRQTDTPL